VETHERLYSENENKFLEGMMNMKKSKLFGYVMTGALSLGVIGGSVSVYAATNDSVSVSSVTEKAKKTQNLDAATQKKVDAILSDTKTQLAKIGVDLPVRGDHHDRFANLDDATKAKAEAIMDKLKAGTLTEAKAKEQLATLGVDLPVRGGHHDILKNLDDATKEKAQAILDKMETELDKLGVDHRKKRFGL
jgi:hypothetical protein